MSDPKAYPLEPSADEMRTMLEQVTNRVIEHIDSLPAQPASYDTDGREVANSFAETLPETGTDLHTLLDRIFVEAVPHSFNPAGPEYLA